MFFSMNEFNFFGAKGGLKNVNDMIDEEVNKKFIKEKEDTESEQKYKTLLDEIKRQDRPDSKDQAFLKAYESIAKRLKESQEEFFRLQEKIERASTLRFTSPSESEQRILSGSGEKIESLELKSPNI